MNRILFTLILLFYCFSTQSQVIYSDNFNENINKSTTSAALQTSIVNEALEIVGNGTGGAWESITYNFHNSGTNINVDASSNQKLYIKVKTSNGVNFRIDLIDINGYVTNQNPSTINPIADYKIFEIDYSQKLKDGGYGGPCNPGPCDVNSSSLTGVMFFFNPGSGGFNGTVEIDWISLGEPLEPFINYEIRYNQLGYFPSKEKLFSLISPTNISSKAFSVLDDSNAVVLTGNSSDSKYWSDAQQHVSIIDVSSINTEGSYKLKTNELEIPFIINNNIYSEVSKASLKYFYFNRASTEISSDLGGVYTRNLGHPDNQVKIHSSAATNERPEGTIISSPKGWYDAGDYNKYVVNSGISTYTLLAAFDHYQSYFIQKQLELPEKGGNLPDLLDEIKWNLDWLLTMQDPNDGGVYHKLTGLNFSGIIMPDQYNFDRYVVTKSTSAALNFAAVLAYASRLFKDYNSVLPNYSQGMLSAAISAYNWAKSNPSAYFSNPSGVNTGEYRDTNLSDEFQWAAVELYIATQSSNYLNDININSIGNGSPSWAYTSPLALISILQNEDKFQANFVTSAKNKFFLTANSIRTKIQNSEMRISMGATGSDYIWGSNSVTANQIMLLLNAYQSTNDTSYLNAAYVATDYFFGRNGTGYSYVTGYGVKKAMKPHHRASEADQIDDPIPGMLVGGPNPGRQDGCPGYLNTSNAGSYVDSWCSYASNEVAINWNAPLAYALNALHYFQNQNSLSIDEFEAENDKIILYPNPSNNLVHIKTNKSINQVIIYNSIGKEINRNNSKLIDVQNLQNGIYFIKIILNDNSVINQKLLVNKT